MTANDDDARAPRRRRRAGVVPQREPADGFLPRSRSGVRYALLIWQAGGQRRDQVWGAGAGEEDCVIHGFVTRPSTARGRASRLPDVRGGGDPGDGQWERDPSEALPADTADQAINGSQAYCTLLKAHFIPSTQLRVFTGALSQTPDRPKLEYHSTSERGGRPGWLRTLRLKCRVPKSYLKQPHTAPPPPPEPDAEHRTAGKDGRAALGARTQAEQAGPL
ncbi:hypothetical protein SKAU_G00175230 [Synaphobranchus kaupii]|uniref:Uncharacterized protein n=1 Tax=Synaphobranchus kaupii TaxID=118154 RepID=A0A9Q1FL58_SYNKA|nr:hypothetical protein SKAU_G00175230 [Synaphobranchus kaupii]